MVLIEKHTAAVLDAQVCLAGASRGQHWRARCHTILMQNNPLYLHPTLSHLIFALPPRFSLTLFLTINLFVKPGWRVSYFDAKQLLPYL